MTEDATMAIDRTTLQSVYTCSHLEMAPDRCTADRAHPTVWTLGSYGPILHPALKNGPLEKGRHQNCEMPPCGHTGVALRGWSHLHLSPTDTPLSSWQVWFRTYRAQLGPNPTLGEVVCTKVLSTSWSTRYQTGASSYPPNASKTPTPRLRKPSQ
jgi:hypothetical protein